MNSVSYDKCTHRLAERSEAIQAYRKIAGLLRYARKDDEEMTQLNEQPPIFDSRFAPMPDIIAHRSSKLEENPTLNIII